MDIATRKNYETQYSFERQFSITNFTLALFFQQLFNKSSVKSLLTNTHYSSDPEELDKPSKQLSAKQMKKVFVY